MKRRFKTKQENERQYGKNWRGQVFWKSPNMDYLFGLPWFDGTGLHEVYLGLTDGRYYWNIYPEYLTTDPHPYEGKEFAIRIDGKKQARKVRERLIVMGFEDDKSWNNLREKREESEYVIVYNDGEFAIHTHDGSSNIIITYDQFMEGFWPDIEDLTGTPPEVLSPQQRYISALEDHIANEDFLKTLKIAAGL